MQTMIFGNENAEKDLLLLDCYIPNHVNCEQIITGRWGTGKTAHLFDKNRKLIATLSEIDKTKKGLWYLNEEELNTDQIIDAFVNLETRKFQRYLKSIWIAEIYRRAALLLSTLRPLYSNAEGLHWELISSISGAVSIGKTIWKQIPNASKVLKSLDDNQTTVVEGIQQEFSKIFDENTKFAIQQCLEDIKDSEHQPVIAIEPIETPLSAIEESSLAQDVISALLNVFQSDFQPSEDQRLVVLISVPWHRFSNKFINFPQKITQYVCYQNWTKEMLRKFINTRIEWEFKRVKRQYSFKGDVDAWDTLFDESVHNDYCQPPISEDSFSYIIRHTNYRPREVQRLARMAVETCSRKVGRSIDDILKGVGGITVNGSHMRDAVSDYTRKATADLVSESTRRYPQIDEIFALIKGMTVPFTTDDLATRLEVSINVSQAIQMLWESGMLGIEVICKNQTNISEFKHLLPKSNYKRDVNKNSKELIRWYFFSYNCENEVAELMAQYKANKMLDVRLIFHPRIFESISASVGTEWPYGI